MKQPSAFLPVKTQAKGLRYRVVAMSSSFLRGTVTIALLAGAAGSLGFMLHAGKNNSKILFLIILFAGWVLSPFVALIVAHGVSKRWPVVTRTALYCVMLIVTAGS